MTQVPPRRYSSATITRAPCSAAMRAARTPPEPPPMTKRSTSRSAMLHIVSALLHLGAHLGHDILGKIVRPSAGKDHALIEYFRLLDESLFAERRLIIRQQILQFLLGKMGGVNAGALIHQLVDPWIELLLHVGRDFGKILCPHEVGLQKYILGLLHHAAHDRLEYLLDILDFDDLLGQRHRCGRRLPRRSLGRRRPSYDDGGKHDQRGQAVTRDAWTRGETGDNRRIPFHA